MAYIPAFETQRDENAPTPWTNCNPASCSMLIDIWTYGRINTSDVILRANDPNAIPLGVGMNYIAVDFCIRVAYPALGPMQFSEKDGSGSSQMTWKQLRTHLGNGGGAACGGTYSSLVGFINEKGQAVNRWQPGGTFGHMMFFCDYREADETVLLMDPLGHGDYAGDRVSLGCLWAYIWKSGNDENAIVTAAHGFASPRPAEPAPPPVQRFSDVPPTHPFYADIDWAAANGIASGRPNGTFGPDEPLTRGAGMAFLHRASGVKP